MPEGPEVAVISKELNEYLTGKTIVQINHDERSRYHKNPLENLMVFNSQQPWKIYGVYSKGKKIIFVVQNDTQRAYLVSSLGMEGRWTVNKTPHCNLWLNLGNEIIYYSDSRHFGILEIVLNDNDFKLRMDKIGPDLLSQEIDIDQWRQRCKIKKYANKSIADVMMNQEWFSGIGAYLRAEILYASGINPHRLVNSLNDNELYMVWYYTIKTIRESYYAQGATIYTFSSFKDNKGKFQMKCYGKKQDDDGNPIITETMKCKRTIHWCPNKQH